MYWTESLSSLTAQACIEGKLGQWLNTDLVMLGLGRVEMITWQTHQAVEKLAMVQEPAILLYCFWKIPEAPAAHGELFIPMETKETES